MNKKFFVAAFVLLLPLLVFSQDFMFYTSIRGNWDTEQNPSRAQFGGNNKLINNYFNELGSLLVGGQGVNGTCEVVFDINNKGEIEGYKINESIGDGYDNAIKTIVLSMSGKWRPGKIDDKFVSETITLWVHVYSGPALKKTLKEYLVESNRLYIKQDYKKALKNVDKALEYDDLNTKAVILKAKILIATNNKEDACRLLESYEKYSIEPIITMYNKECDED